MRRIRPKVNSPLAASVMIRLMSLCNYALMQTARIISVNLVIILGLCGVGCSASGRTASPQSPTKLTPLYASELLPLENNTVLEFDTAIEGNGEKGRLVMQVRRPHDNRIELDVAGKIRRLEAKAEGVSIATGGWLLKQPITVGATFQGLSGRVTVVGIDRTLDVPAGHFTKCVETEEVTSATVTRTVFCPGVGITKLVIEGNLNGEPRRETAELRFRGPRIDIGTEKTTAAPAGQ